MIPYARRNSQTSESRANDAIESNDILTNTYLFTQCQICNNPKPPRCHHCLKCNLCILRYDHHSIFLGICVGINNHKYYILSLFYTICNVIITLYEYIGKTENSKILVIITASIIGLVGCFALYRFIKTIYFLCLNITDIEHSKCKKNV